jgi:hypothetical protein
MAKYKLLSQHYSEEDKLLEPDTIVGDGTEHKWSRPPTTEMVALDEDGKQQLERERIRAGERIAPIDDLPLTMGEVKSKYDREVEAAEPIQVRRQAATLVDRARR